jgi:hypothetical protein
MYAVVCIRRMICLLVIVRSISHTLVYVRGMMCKPVSWCVSGGWYACWGVSEGWYIWRCVARGWYVLYSDTYVLEDGTVCMLQCVMAE